MVTVLPSSTAGIYNFVNNSTNASATLTVSYIVHGGATTRATTYVLGGANTGANIATNLLEGAGNNTGGITKVGPGTWILAGTNDYKSGTPINVNGGTLAVQNPGAFGVAATITVTSNSTLRLDGVSLTTGGVTPTTVLLRNTGTVQMNGNGTNNLRLDTAPGTSATVKTTSSGDVLTVSTNSGGAIDTVLHVSGPGLIFFTNTSTYAGIVSVDAGTMQIGNTAALGSGQLVTVGSGATLDVSPLGAVIYTPTPAAFGGRGTGTAVGSTAATIKADAGGAVDLSGKDISLTYTPTSFTGDATHPALYVSQGTLTLNGNAFTINNASGTPLGVGAYLLVQQASGNITSGGGYFALIQGSGTAPGTVGTISVTGGNVYLNVFNYSSKGLVWKGGTPNNWDNGTTANWLDGANPSVFTVSDSVTFDSTGAANPLVSIVGTLAPNAIQVDTTSANYTFAGSGRIVGATALTKVGTGTLLVQNPNVYSGGTIVSGGTLRLGASGVLPSSVAGASVTVSSPSVLDMNTFNTTIGGLAGDGIVDNQGAGPSTLTIGIDNNNASFTGVIKNTSGTLGLTKVGTGIETILGANTYVGQTLVSAGTLRLGNLNALSAGASPLVLTNGGSLDVRSSLLISNLYGASGTLIANNSSATTNILIFQADSTNVASTISDGSGGGGIGIQLNSGYLQLMGPNTYSGGTILASGTTLGIGVVNTVASGNAGSGSIIASNHTTVTLTSAVSTSSQLGSPIVTVDNAMVTFTSSGTADSFNGGFIGGPTATNIFGGNMSIAGGNNFSNFLGRVIFTNISPNAVRFNTSLINGDQAIFDFEGGGVQTRDATTVTFGALTGNGGIYSPSVTPGATYIIGAKGLDTTYSGSIGGSNSIVKTGVGRLTLSGGTAPVLFLDSNFNLVTNIVYTNTLTYLNTTTVSNGVLALSAPANLNSNTVITLAGTTAVLDASAMGYGVSQLDANAVLTNKFLVTNGVFEVISGQTLAGFGTLQASNVLLDAGSIFNVGLPVGSFTVNTSVELAGAVNMSVNTTNSPNASELLAPSFIVDGTATLVVTNRGPENYGVFQLFNHPVTIPHVLPTLTGTNLWVDNLAVDGSITLVAPVFVPPVNTNSTSITTSVSGGNLTLTWPADHTGWRLQTQTNSLAIGISTNWVDVAGATLTNQVVVPITATNDSVYFRMIYP